MGFIEALIEPVDPDVMSSRANPAIFFIWIRPAANQRPAPAGNPRQTRKERLGDLGNDMYAPRSERLVTARSNSK